MALEEYYKPGQTVLVVESSKEVQYSQKNKENLNFLTAWKLLEILCRLGFEKSYAFKNGSERSYAFTQKT